MDHPGDIAYLILFSQHIVENRALGTAGDVLGIPLGIAAQLLRRRLPGLSAGGQHFLIHQQLQLRKIQMPCANEIFFLTAAVGDNRAIIFGKQLYVNLLIDRAIFP